jgi:hypothetical protein
MPFSPPTKEHTMTDPYRIADIPAAPQAMRPTGDHKGVLRPLLWVLLVISATGNVVASGAGLDVLVGVGFGLLTLTFGTALAVHHYRNRRS